jgi:neutral/alkaline ceramidase-like enzyme
VRRLIAALGLAVAAVAAAPAGLDAALSAGAASVEIAVPDGTPLAGYGGLQRRAWFPPLWGGSDHAFWFRPAAGVHDLPRARALVLESGPTRVLWLAVDLVGVDPTLVDDLRGRLARDGHRFSAVVVSASHTHSGPGAFAHSALFAFVAVDRLSREVRDRILDALESAARQADARRAPALVGAGRAEVGGVASSRLSAPLDPELGLLKVVRRDGRPVAAVWNYAIHGTALSSSNLLLSGDVMAEAGRRIEARIDAPALFVNGAVGDVSPARRGWRGVEDIGAQLSAAAVEAWERTAAVGEGPLAAVSAPVTLPEPSLRLRNCAGRWIPRWVALPLDGALATSSEMVALAVGPSAWVTVPGELETSLGLAVKAAGRGRFSHVFVAGVSNDYLGYFLSAAAYDRPSYIACASFYGETGGEAIAAAATALLRRLDREPAPRPAPR